MTRGYVLRYKDTDGNEFEVGPDLHLGYANWNSIALNRAFVFDTDDMAKLHNSIGREVDIPDSAYTIPYVNRNYITVEEFDGLYDEYRDQPNTEILHSLIRYKTLHYLLEQYYKGRYVLDPYDGDPIKRYEDVQVDVDGLDGTVKIFIKRQPRIDV